jgi:hypothetical protein
MGYEVSKALPLVIARSTITLALLISWSGAIGGPNDSSSSLAQVQKSTPTPELEPADVVRIQVEALRGNGPDDEGIEVTFRFASPGNKRSTGPLARFAEMVRTAPYDRLLNHLNAEYSPTKLSDDKAYQLVTITDRLGVKITYLWVLSKQIEGEFEGCWMTDAVIPSETRQQGRLIPTSYY